MKYINMGFIQNGAWTEVNSLYDDGSRHTWDLQGNNYYIDYIIGRHRSRSPWTDTQGVTGTNEFFAPTSDPLNPITNLDFVFTDRPALPGSDDLSTIVLDPITQRSVRTITRINIRMDFRLFFAVSTTDCENDANNIYTPLAEANWHFDGHGVIANYTTYRPLVGVAGNGGDTMFNDPGTTPMLTTGYPMNEIGNRNHVWHVQ